VALVNSSALDRKVAVSSTVRVYAILPTLGRTVKCVRLVDMTTLGVWFAMLRPVPTMGLVRRMGLAIVLSDGREHAMSVRLAFMDLIALHANAAGMEDAYRKPAPVFATAHFVEFSVRILRLYLRHLYRPRLLEERQFSLLAITFQGAQRSLLVEGQIIAPVLRQLLRRRRRALLAVQSRALSPLLIPTRTDKQ